MEHVELEKCTYDKGTQINQMFDGLRKGGPVHPYHEDGPSRGLKVLQSGLITVARNKV